MLSRLDPAGKTVCARVPVVEYGSLFPGEVKSGKYPRGESSSRWRKPGSNAESTEGMPDSRIPRLAAAVPFWAGFGIHLSEPGEWKISTGEEAELTIPILRTLSARIIAEGGTRSLIATATGGQ